MKRYILLIIATAVVVGTAFGADRRAVGGKPAPAASRDLTDAEVRTTMDQIFRGRVGSIIAWTDSLAGECTGAPRYHLMRARLLRERIPVDDEQKEDLKRETQALHRELEQVIAYCDPRIASGEGDPSLRLYRGWAWMMMSHVHTYEKSFWSAGREAKKGKDDLEWCLQRNPNDPVASSLMGAFLYFADTLPSAYKFVSKLLFMPSGDRDRGLQMMEEARGSSSAMEIDNQLILYSVYIGFEGRFEEGLDGFETLRGKFPCHATFLRPEAVMYPLLPRRTADFGDSLDAGITRVLALPAGEADEMTNILLQFERACADRFYNPARAIDRFETLLAKNPPHPDWVAGYSAFELGCMMASRGNEALAREYWDRVLKDNRIKYMHEEVKAMKTYLRLHGCSQGAGPSDPAAIYLADDAPRAAVRQDLGGVESPTVADMFYLGEAWLLSNEPEKALDAYTGALNPQAAPWEECYQMLACARAGEIMGSRGEYIAASKHYERAGKFWHKEFLYDWILEARKRYFARLDEGKEKTPPTLLSKTTR